MRKEGIKPKGQSKIPKDQDNADGFRAAHIGTLREGPRHCRRQVREARLGVRQELGWGGSSSSMLMIHWDSFFLVYAGLCYSWGTVVARDSGRCSAKSCRERCRCRPGGSISGTLLVTRLDLSGHLRSHLVAVWSHGSHELGPRPVNRHIQGESPSD
jgi:hypothetical protein